MGVPLRPNVRYYLLGCQLTGKIGEPEQVRWYYAKRGCSEVRGCDDEKQLRQLVRRGVLASDDLVWRETNGDAWREMSSVPELSSRATGRGLTWLLFGLFVLALVLFATIRYGREWGQLLSDRLQ